MKILKKILGYFFMFISLMYLTTTFTNKDGAYITLPTAILFGVLSIKLLNINLMGIFSINEKIQLEKIRKEKEFLQSECERLSAISKSSEINDALSLNKRDGFST